MLKGKVLRRENASAKIILVFAFASAKGKKREAEASVVGKSKFSRKKNVFPKKTFYGEKGKIEEQFACLT